MENFNEFDQPQVPEKNTGDIISHAFNLFKGVFLYGTIIMVLYSIASFAVQYLSGFDSNAFNEEIMAADGDFSQIDMQSFPGFTTYMLLSMLLAFLLAPMYVGFLYVVDKYNKNQRFSFGDLFYGFKHNLVNTIIYSFISSIIMGIAMIACVIPVFFVAPLLLLGYPILTFENASATAALSKSFNIAKENYGTFLGVAILAILISMAGIVLCGIGVLLTAMFYIVAIYSLYVAFVGVPRNIVFSGR